MAEFLDIEAVPETPETPTPNGRFRFQGKNVLLTYAQAHNITKDMLFNFLIQMGAEKCVVGRELHEDGNQHFHALVEFKKKVSTRRPDYFDFMGYHPNIVRPESIEGSYKYVTKDGDTQETNPTWVFKTKESITAITLEVAKMPNMSHNEAVVEVVKRGGDRALKIIHQVNTFMQMIKKPSAKYMPLADLETFNLEGWRTWTDPIKKFMIDVAQGSGAREERMSLWLHGPSRMGKTWLARSLGVHWYMQGMWNLERFDDDAEYGVMDDMPWENGLQKYFKTILGCQLDVTVTDKYMKKGVIRHGRPVLIITNTLPDFSQEDLAWLRVNVNFCGVFQKCYKEEDEVMGEAQDPYSVLSSQ